MSVSCLVLIRYCTLSFDNVVFPKWFPLQPEMTSCEWLTRDAWWLSKSSVEKMFYLQLFFVKQKWPLLEFDLVLVTALSHTATLIGVQQLSLRGWESLLAGVRAGNWGRYAEPEGSTIAKSLRSLSFREKELSLVLKEPLFWLCSSPRAFKQAHRPLHKPPRRPRKWFPMKQ